MVQRCAQQLGKKENKVGPQTQSHLRPNWSNRKRPGGKKMAAGDRWLKTNYGCTLSISQKLNHQNRKNIFFYTHTFHRRFPSATFNRTCAHKRQRTSAVPLQSRRVKNEHVTVQRIKTRHFRIALLPWDFFSRPAPRGSIQRVTHYSEGRVPLVIRGVGGFLPCILSISPAAAQRALCHLINQKSWPQVAHRSQSRRQLRRKGTAEVRGACLASPEEINHPECLDSGTPPGPLCQWRLQWKSPNFPHVPARQARLSPTKRAVLQEMLRNSIVLEWMWRGEKAKATGKRLLAEASWNLFRADLEKRHGQNERSVQIEDSPRTLRYGAAAKSMHSIQNWNEALLCFFSEGFPFDTERTMYIKTASTSKVVRWISIMTVFALLIFFFNLFDPEWN